MAQNYTSIAEKNLAGGINQQAAEDSIPDGYVEEAVNVLINSEGLIKKRPGFRTYLGHIPLRVAKVTWDKDATEQNLTFEFTASEHPNVDIDLSDTASTALLVVGRTSVPINCTDNKTEFDTKYSYRYYTGFQANPRKYLEGNSPANTELFYPQTEHAHNTPDIFVGLSESLAVANKDNAVLVADEIRINENTTDVAIHYRNTAADSLSVFVYSLALSGFEGVSYSAIYNTDPDNKINITSNDHGLNSFNIMVRCYEGGGTGTVTEIIPDSLTVDGVTGQVTLTFSEAKQNIKVLLHTPNVANIYREAVSGNTISNFELPNLDNDFIFVDCYKITNGLWTRVFPNRISVDSVNKTAFVEFNNNSPDSSDIVLIWDTVSIKTTKLSVESELTLSSSGQDAEPELSVYGILAEDVYKNNDASDSTAGWVQHIDTYKTEGNTAVVANLGWNLFRGRLRETAPSYLACSVMYPNLRTRIVGDNVLAPAFHSNTQTITRTRGGLSFVGGGSGWGKISEIKWDVNNSSYTVKITAEQLQVVNNPIEIFDLANGAVVGDLLTIRGAELRAFSGDWRIVGTDYDTQNGFINLSIRTGFAGSDYNCGPIGEAGVFTDALQLESTTKLLITKGDKVLSQSFPEGTSVTFIGASPSLKMFVSDVFEELRISTGQAVFFSRENKYCYGPRNAVSDFVGFSSEKGLVLTQGDMLEFTDVPVPIEVASVFPKNDEIADARLEVVDGVGTLYTSAALSFNVGQYLPVTALGFYSAELKVTAIAANGQSLELDCTGIPDVILDSVYVPAFFQLKEPISFSDDFFNRNAFAVEGRWECIEKPQIDTPNLDRYALIEPTVTEHFDALDYGAQPPIRSTMSQDSLYLTNAIDPIQKYDGVATYRAGLPRWNPQLFMTTGASPTSTLTVGKYGYYFRLTAFDENESVCISAVTGAADYFIEVAATHSVHMRLLGFPNWDDYDFEKISLEIYRTLVDAPGEYFLVTRLEMPQTPSGGYIDYVDILGDDLIQLQGQDERLNATYGLTELATTLSEPLRAKYMTSTDNRIVLANIRDWQRIDLNFSKLDGLIKARGDDDDEKTYDFYGKTLTIRNDSEDTGTGTDMLNRVTYEFRVKEQHIAINKTTSFVDVFYDSSTKLLSVKFTVSETEMPKKGDWIYLMNHSGSPSTIYALRQVGLYQIHAVSSTTEIATVSIYMPNFTGTLNPDNRVIDAAISHVCISATGGSGNVPVYIDTDDDSYHMIRGNANDITMITRRLAAAVNMSMRMVDIGIPGYESFKPWIMADAGGEYNAGDIKFSRPKESSKFFSIDLPTFDADSGILMISRGSYVTGEVVSAQRRFPSRILFSYRNFPEVFNRSADLLITAAEAAELSPIDVNAADGQEITGIVPFFGESAFGQATRESLLVAFKSNSIYVVNIATKGVQKIESNGLGCTAPYSIAATKDGIMFANESGIYKLTRQLTVEPVGQFVDRTWQNEIDLTALSLVQGHHYGVGRQYKLSVPLKNAGYNSDVLVYEHTRESRGQVGTWTRHTNHRATGWCNLFTREFFSTTQGRVCTTKDTGGRLDFSDRGSAISAEVVLRSNDFGIPNTRKKLLHMSVNFRTPQEDEANLSQQNTSVLIATDLTEDFQLCGNYTGSTGFSNDKGLTKGETLRFTVPVTKAIRFQPKIVNNTVYQTLQFSGVIYRVAGLTTQGTKEVND